MNLVSEIWIWGYRTLETKGWTALWTPQLLPCKSLSKISNENFYLAQWICIALIHRINTNPFAILLRKLTKISANSKYPGSFQSRNTTKWSEEGWDIGHKSEEASRISWHRSGDCTNSNSWTHHLDGENLLSFLWLIFSLASLHSQF